MAQVVNWVCNVYVYVYVYLKSTGLGLEGSLTCFYVSALVKEDNLSNNNCWYRECTHRLLVLILMPCNKFQLND